MNKETITPTAAVHWTDLNKPDKYGYYGIILEFDPKNNEEHKKFLTELKEECAKVLTGKDAREPWWQPKANKNLYCVRFGTKYKVEEWINSEEEEIPQPKYLVRGTKVRVKFKQQAGKTGKFLNIYLNGVQIIEIPKQEEKDEYEDPEDVPF